MKSECWGTFCKRFKSGSSLVFKCPIPQCLRNKGASKEQLEIIKNFFEKIFNKENIDKMEDVKPSKMNDPFTAEEIKTAAKRLKNNKSPGVDNINAY